MDKTEDGGPAFPVQDAASWQGHGMSLRQYAAIRLRVPNSGTDWLDEMIRTSLRDDLAEKAMQGLIGCELPRNIRQTELFTRKAGNFTDFKLRTDKKILPASVINEATARADAKNDSYRLDALEAVAKASGTGVSFDWCRHVEDGMVVEHGYRMMWKHTIGPREKSIRHAIDAAMEVFKP